MKVGFIGVGNMGSCLARCVACDENNEIILSNHNPAKTQLLADKYDCQIMSNVDLIKTSNIVFLGIKPQVVDNFFIDNEIKNAFAENSNVVLVSMLAGITLEKLKALSGLKNIVRIMPNTPVRESEGFTSIASFCEANSKLVAELLKASGDVAIIDESLMDVATAVAGCGPAFVYEFIDALAQGGVENGLDYDVAIKMASQTVLGSAKMVQNSCKSTKQLCEDVCSPGGATIEGVNYLRDNNFEDLVKQAVTKAYNKSKSLG